ncbi:MAG: lytic murein transglycosylase [Desulfovibrionaceae bacterium]|nr:lytic murein transglycosylase [Desulfovibrionaceae bacterium]MBF0514307.1 lytic murein transglycosylase [Desulfovibrionaceae bacterium]
MPGNLGKRPGRAPAWIAALALAAALCPCLARPALAGRWDALIERLAGDGLDRGVVASTFARPEVRYDPGAMGKKLMEYHMAAHGSLLVSKIQARLGELEYYFGPADGRLNYLTKMGVKAFQAQNGLAPDGLPSAGLLAAAMAQSAKAPEALGLRGLVAPKVSVYESVLTPERLAEAEAFYRDNLSLLRGAQARYGAPEEIIVGLLTVETRVGKFLGEDLAVGVLASMAVSPSYASVAAVFSEENVTPAQAAWLDAKAAEKAQWAYRELKALFAYASANHLDIMNMPGSIYGAIGLCQFMPSNVSRFGVDGDGDGCVNLFNAADAVYSLANYLNYHGLTPGAGIESQRKALYHYNHSLVYVNTIMAVAGHLRGEPLP